MARELAAISVVVAIEANEPVVPSILFQSGKTRRTVRNFRWNATYAGNQIVGST